MEVACTEPPLGKQANMVSGSSRAAQDGAGEPSTQDSGAGCHEEARPAEADSVAEAAALLPDPDEVPLVSGQMPNQTGGQSRQTSVQWQQHTLLLPSVLRGH